MKSCFLFGHRDAPWELEPWIRKAVERHYQQYGVRQFYVGNHGSFDRMALSAVRAVKKIYPDLELYLVAAYPPFQRPDPLPDGFDNSFYPPLEGVPPRYAIMKANQYMVNVSDTIICYAAHFGNTRNLLESVEKRASGRDLLLENLGNSFTPPK